MNYSVNALAMPLLKKLEENSDTLQLSIARLGNGAKIIDAGIETAGSIEAGRQIAEICLAGLGQVDLVACDTYANVTWALNVKSKQPVLACLASQYAGWHLSHGEGKQAFYAIGSGPARAIGSKEPLFKELSYRDTADASCMVIETDKIPPPELTDQIATACNIDAENLTLILTPTTSICGVTQIVARVLETALHKIHTLGFPLDTIIAGKGHAPICPVADDFMVGMGRTNDAILFAGTVHLDMQADDKDIADLIDKLPSSASSNYGKLFVETFKEADYDFYKIDPMLFSPAKITITSVATGKTYTAGKINKQLLDMSFSS